MRCSPEILQRVGEAYRKIRNTARFALGNLEGFDPSRDSMPYANMLRIDRWAMDELRRTVERVREAYERYEFHTVYQTLYHFCTVTLSARYFDIIKDRLYTSAPKSHARRSAQIALYMVADVLTKMLAPVLVFTAEEVWENLPRREGANEHHASEASIHLQEFPPSLELTAERANADDELAHDFARLFEIRDAALRRLEEARTAKLIGSSLEARVRLAASGETFALLDRYKDDLRYLFIVSEVQLEEAATGELRVQVERAAGEKCERCWNYSVHVGEFAGFPAVCERCADALTGILKETA